MFLLPWVGWSLSQIHMHNDVAGWLPKDDPQAKILSWYQTQFPSESRILIAWDDSSITDPRIERFRDEILGKPVADGQREGGSPYFDTVTAPVDLLTRMLDRDIPFDTALQRIEGVLSGPGPLRVRLTDAGRMRGEYMQSEILRLAKESFGPDVSIVSRTMPMPSSSGIAEDDTTAWKLHDHLTEYIQSQPLHDLQLSWPGMHTDPERLEAFRSRLLSIEAPASGTHTTGKTCVDDTYFVSGSLAAITVALSEQGVADRKAAIEKIYSAAAAAGIDEEKLRLGGQPVVGVQLNAAVKHAGWNRAYPIWDLPHRSPVLLSAVVTIVFSFIMLRSLRLAILVQTVAFLTVGVTVALVPITGGSMNMVLVVMPTLLAVLTTSAAIHLANYWKHSGKLNPADSVFKAAMTAWLPCFLASATTSIGMASLMASNLVPVRDFGVYSAIGCILSFLAVLYVLPSLMLYWPKQPPEAEQLQTDHWNALGRWIAGHRHLVAGTCVLATVAAGYGLVHFRTETKVIRYFPEESRLVQDYMFLEDNLSGIISIDTIVRFDEEAQQSLSFIERARIVMDVQDDIRGHSEISGVLSLASFLDLREADPETMSRAERMRLNFAHKQTERKIKERLGEGGERAKGISSFLALPTQATDWKQEGDAQLNAAGDELWRITAQASIMSDVDFQDLTGDMDKIAGQHLALIGSPGTGHVVTGLIPVFLRTQQAVLESLIRSFGMAFVLIAIVMMFVLKSPRAGIVTMLPNLMPVVIVFGLLSWYRLRVDIGTMITASVALGIAVDGTLHLLTWFRQLVGEGMSVEDAVARSLEHCGPAMWQTSAAVGLGMLTLLPAELLLISRFGWMLAALIFAALCADVLFLPALLAGRLGYLIRGATNADDADDDQKPASPQPADTRPELAVQCSDEEEVTYSDTRHPETLQGSGPSRGDLNPHIDEARKRWNRSSQEAS
jgi:predicted RND superfamily exporter protein